LKVFATQQNRRVATVLLRSKNKVFATQQNRRVATVLLRSKNKNGSYKFINAFLEPDQGQIQNNAKDKFVMIYHNQISYKIAKKSH
jgi:hypothetical protein